MTIVTTRLIINGKVQGVWYRKSTKEKADELGISGTVQNLSSGKVKIVAQGQKRNIDALIEWSKVGPKFAEVQSVSATPILEPLHFDSFTILR